MVCGCFGGGIGEALGDAAEPGIDNDNMGGRLPVLGREARVGAVTGLSDGVELVGGIILIDLRVGPYITLCLIDGEDFDISIIEKKQALISTTIMKA